jgi:hypothetical protein
VPFCAAKDLFYERLLNADCPGDGYHSAIVSLPQWLKPPFSSD